MSGWFSPDGKLFWNVLKTVLFSQAKGRVNMDLLLDGVLYIKCTVWIKAAIVLYVVFCMLLLCFKLWSTQSHLGVRWFQLWTNKLTNACPLNWKSSDQIYWIIPDQAYLDYLGNYTYALSLLTIKKPLKKHYIYMSLNGARKMEMSLSYLYVYHPHGCLYLLGKKDIMSHAILRAL